MSEEDFTSFQASSTEEMVNHLKAHTKNGDYVPEDTYMRLWRDNAENFEVDEDEHEKILDAIEHWVNDATIPPVTKVEMLEKHIEQVIADEHSRVVKILEQKIKAIHDQIAKEEPGSWPIASWHDEIHFLAGIIEAVQDGK